MEAQVLLKNRWRHLLAPDSSPDSPLPHEALFEGLVKALGESHRKYHNAVHIAQLLRYIATYREAFQKPHLAEWVALYHDAIYDSHRFDNEEMSAQWAERDLAEMGLPDSEIAWVADTIRRTAGHRGEGADTDAQLFLDLDLSILGSDPETYQTYVAQIREEYRWVPGLLYRRKRKKIMKGFLNRPQLYFHEMLRSRWEKQARINIQKEIE